MVRDLLIKAMGFFGATVTPSLPAAILDAAHDNRVHRARGLAQNAQVELERAIRQARRSIALGNTPEDIDRRVAEIDDARMQIERIVKDHRDDPDADLLRGMDKS